MLYYIFGKKKKNTNNKFLNKIKLYNSYFLHVLLYYHYHCTFTVYSHLKLNLLIKKNHNKKIKILLVLLK